MLPAADIFLALRYLRPKRTFISVITLLSVLGPVLGVAVLIIVTSVMSGFDHDIRQAILGMQGHLQVFPGWGFGPAQSQVFEDTGPVLAALERVGAVGAPVMEGPVLVQLRNEVTTKFVKGILPEAEKRVTNIHKNPAFQGRFEIEEGEALIGSKMARELGLRIGDQLLIHAPKRLTGNIKWGDDGQVTVKEPDEVYFPEEVTVAGIFSMGVSDYDEAIMFIHLDQADELFGQDWGSASSVHASVPDPFRMDRLTQNLIRELKDCRVVTWQEANKVLFDTLRVEKSLMFFLLTFIVIVAAFGIAGTLITVAVQKTREIGVLKAMGVDTGVIARIFVLQGAIIGLLGTTLGAALGVLIVHFRDRVADFLELVMRAEVFPDELYHLSKIPGRVAPGDVALIVVLALVICVLASLVPALYAATLSPAKALQEEG